MRDMADRESGDMGDTGDIGDDQGWGASDNWDDGQPGTSMDARSERGGRGVTRGAPLSPEEIPPWLRRATEYDGRRSGGGAESAEYGYDRVGNTGNATPQREPGPAPDGWGDEREWDNRAGDWDEWRGEYDDRESDGWNRQNQGASRRNPRDEWGSAGYEPDPYTRDGYARENGGNAGAEWQGQASPGYEADEDPYASQWRSDSRGQRDPYADADYSSYDESGGDYDAEYDDDDYSRQRKGWRGFFRRGE